MRSKGIWVPGLAQPRPRPTALLGQLLGSAPSISSRQGTRSPGPHQCGGLAVGSSSKCCLCTRLHVSHGSGGAVGVVHQPPWSPSLESPAPQRQGEAQPRPLFMAVCLHLQRLGRRVRSCQAARSSAWHWPGLWYGTPLSSSWMKPPARWTPRASTW